MIIDISLSIARKALQLRDNFIHIIQECLIQFAEVIPFSGDKHIPINFFVFGALPLHDAIQAANLLRNRRNPHESIGHIGQKIHLAAALKDINSFVDMLGKFRLFYIHQR